MHLPRPWALAAILTALWGGCSQDADNKPVTDGAPDTTASLPDQQAAPDLLDMALPPPDVCMPGCHWDCFFSGRGCSGGKVWSYGRGAVPCCKPSDPWTKGPGPACSMGNALYTCKDSRCQKLDARYEHCINPKKGYPMAMPADSKYHPHLFALFCPADAPLAKAGDACKTDAACRPMHASVKGRLTCDKAAGKCKEVARPAAPANLGKTCGLKDDGTLKNRTADYGYTDPNTGVVCHWRWDSKNSCLAQGVTTTCRYDEDCPKGMVCVCVVGNNQPLVAGAYQVCAAATSRDTVAGRTAGLKCH